MNENSGNEKNGPDENSPNSLCTNSQPPVICYDIYLRETTSVKWNLLAALQALLNFLKII